MLPSVARTAVLLINRDGRKLLLMPEKETAVAAACYGDSSIRENQLVYFGEWKNGKYHGEGMFFQFPARHAELG